MRSSRLLVWQVSQASARIPSAQSTRWSTHPHPSSVSHTSSPPNWSNHQSLTKMTASLIRRGRTLTPSSWTLRSSISSPRHRFRSLIMPLRYSSNQQQLMWAGLASFQQAANFHPSFVSVMTLPICSSTWMKPRIRSISLINRHLRRDRMQTWTPTSTRWKQLTQQQK